MPDPAEQQQNPPPNPAPKQTEAQRMAGLASADRPLTEPAGGSQQEAKPPAQRPDNVPEKFWDTKTGAVRVDDVLKSYTELEKLRGRMGTDAEANARAKIEGELWGKRPEKPDAYPMAALPDAVDVHILAEPPGADFVYEPGKTYLPLNPQSPTLQKVRDLAFRAGASAEEFQGLLVEFARENGQRVPTDADLAAARQSVWNDLGEHGERRVQHLWGSLRSTVGPDRANDLEPLLRDAKGISALEELVALASGSRFNPPAAGVTGSGPLTEASVRAMHSDPRYLAGDPAFRAEVEKAWSTLYPG